jgi:cytochrome P450
MGSDLVRIRMGPWWWTLAATPAAAQHVLQTKASNYRKGFFARSFRPVVGDGLLLSEGGSWLRHRRVAQRAFHRKRLAPLLDVVAEATRVMLGRWERIAAAEEPVDVADEMTTLTLAITGHVLFGVDLTDEAAEIGKAAAILMEHTNHRFSHVASLPEWVPTPRNFRFRRAFAALERSVQDILARGTAAGETRGNLVTLLSEARRAEGSDMSDAQVRDELRAFLLAGHETTASTPAWTLALLAERAELVDRLRAEASTVLGDRPPEFADATRLPLISAVIDETIRLYPPGWAFDRQAVDEDTIAGFRVPPGALVVVSPWVVHRDPRVWDRPEEFDPTRFAPEQAAGRLRFAYFPFGGGPRICIGEELALVEARLIVAMTLRRFRLRPAPGWRIAADPSVTLRPRHGVRVLLCRT